MSNDYCTQCAGHHASARCPNARRPPLLTRALNVVVAPSTYEALENIARTSGKDFDEIVDDAIRHFEASLVVTGFLDEMKSVLTEEERRN